MAKTQIKVGFWRRLFGWSGRHKVIAAFSVLFLAIFLFFAGSWGALQVQIHFERERFMSVSRDMRRVDDRLDDLGDVRSRIYCYYESSPTEFIKGERLCVVRAEVTVLRINMINAVDFTQKAKDVLLKSGFEPSKKVNRVNATTLAMYSFTDHGVGCSLDSEYYAENSPVDSRLQGAPEEANALYMQIICSQSAKAEYFPVTDN